VLILITASRDLQPDDTPAIEDGLRTITANQPGPHLLIHGDCEGGDLLAARIADAWGWPTKAFPADWYGPCRTDCAHGPRRRRRGETRTYCPAAGTYRNAQMIAQRPDAALAVYKRGAKCVGTGRCDRAAGLAGIPVTRRTA
jgi:hypothetical protein